jgi:hypothetical protein
VAQDAAWLRFMRCAQAGGPDSAGLDAVGDARLEASPPPIVPSVEEPPVLAKLDRAPEAKLSCIARAAARLTGAAAAPAAARPTPARPDATPDAPDCPAEARQ